MAARLAPCLVRLRGEINALWPARDKSSDGWIGDTAHSSRKSDHNPDAAGIVRAIDVDEDGIPAWSVVNQIIRDSRVAYVIYEGRIWENPAVYSGRGYWRAYSGPNPHAHHFHVSSRRGATWDGDTRPWGLTRTASATGPGSGGAWTGPDVTAPTPIEEDDLMSALSYEEQRRVLQWADLGLTALGQLRAVVDETAALVRTHVGPTHAGVDIALAGLQNVTNGVMTLLGRATGDVDEQALADALGPLLTSRALDDADLDRIATAVQDEQDRRARERLA